MTYTYQIAIKKPSAISYSQDDDFESFLETLISELSPMFGIHRQQLYEKCRVKNVKYCRWIIWEIVWAKFGLSLKKTGSIFGNYDHTTVMHALIKLPEVFEKNDYVKFIYEHIIKKMQIDKKQLRQKRRKVPIIIPQPDFQKPLSQPYLKQKINRLHKLKSA